MALGTAAEADFMHSPHCERFLLAGLGIYMQCGASITPELSLCFFSNDATLPTQALIKARPWLGRFGYSEESWLSVESTAFIRNKLFVASTNCDVLIIRDIHRATRLASYDCLSE